MLGGLLLEMALAPYQLLHKQLRQHSRKHHRGSPFSIYEILLLELWDSQNSKIIYNKNRNCFVWLLEVRQKEPFFLAWLCVS